jgi:hypothetical protein
VGCAGALVAGWADSGSRERRLYRELDLAAR